jgi:Ca-activated chloride channel family protein
MKVVVGYPTRKEEQLIIRQNVESLQLIYQQIDRLEKSKFDVITKTKYEELFIYFIIAALIFITLELVLKYTLLRTFP